MEELVNFSKSVLLEKNISDRMAARKIAEWALPGDRYQEKLKCFEQSGLSLKPFYEVVKIARELAW